MTVVDLQDSILKTNSLFLEKIDQRRKHVVFEHYTESFDCNNLKIVCNMNIIATDNLPVFVLIFKCCLTSLIVHVKNAWEVGSTNVKSITWALLRSSLWITKSVRTLVLSSSICSEGSPGGGSIEIRRNNSSLKNIRKSRFQVFRIGLRSATMGHR